MKKKIGLYLLSLSLLFVSVIILTVRIPWPWSEFSKKIFRDGHFLYGEFLSCSAEFFLTNLFPLCCLLLIFVGGVAFYDFKFSVRGTPELSFCIEKVDSIEHEHLSFLTTYVIPLVCFDFGSSRSIFVFFILLVVIGWIYIRTNLFYANPTLAILGFRIYRVLGSFRDGKTRRVILITRDELCVNDCVEHITIDDGIYYAYKKGTDENL